MVKNKVWKKLSSEEMRSRIKQALANNVNFQNKSIFGVPASYLDSHVFYSDAPFLAEAPFLSSLVANPNHIGCHTLGHSEPFFEGTHDIEREVIRICAEDIFLGEEGQHDGYIASGGTEANIQALWAHRNFFMKERNARLSEIAVICSIDTHYSVYKGGNLLQIEVQAVDVNESDRNLIEEDLRSKVSDLKRRGVKYIIVINNMMTTMFGSVDRPDIYSEIIEKEGLEHRIHIDGAFGGFIYPFSYTDNYHLSFQNPNVLTVTLDAHKMVQAPYGTGIFLARKGIIDYVLTDQAKYVKGMDITFSGSRSGANAVAVWMILQTYGPHGWFEKIGTLVNRAAWLTKNFDRLNIQYFRPAYSNIITIRAEDINHDIAHKYGLVPDNHEHPKWFKIVVMEHVTVDKMEPFLEEIEGANV